MSEAAEDAPPPRRSRRHGRRSDRFWKIADAVFFALLLPAAGWICWQSYKLIKADFQMMEGRAMVYAWAAGKSHWNIPDWVFARDSLLAAMRTTPDNATIHDLLGVLYTVRARDAWRNVEVQKQYYREAAKYQRSSLALRPRHGWTWAALAESLQGIEPGSAEMWDAWRKAHRWAPYEPPVQLTLLDIGLRAWRSAPEDVKATMKHIYATSQPAEKAFADGVAQKLKVAGWK